MYRQQHIEIQEAARMLGINRGSFSKKLNQITSNELGLVESL
nr:helix-turn-helix domain-containing protein [Vibrio cyclitrophicus]